jgi:hypothetical protein
MQQLEVAMRKQRWVLTVAAAASFTVSLDTLVVTTALPTIRHELGASLSSLEWTVNAYTLTFAVLLMSAAALGDRYGRRRMFVWRGVVRSRVGRLRARAKRGSVGCGAWRAGRRRGLRHATGAGAVDGSPRAARAPARSRHLRRRGGQRRGARAAARRRARAGHLLAVDLLAQPAAGGGADHDHSCPP